MYMHVLRVTMCRHTSVLVESVKCVAMVSIERSEEEVGNLHESCWHLLLVFQEKEDLVWVVRK